MYLLDTNVISEQMRQHPQPAVAEWLHVQVMSYICRR